MSQWQTTTLVLAVLAWWLSPPSSLGDLASREALRRQMTPKATRTLTNQDVAALAPRAVPSAAGQDRSSEPAAESVAVTKPSAASDHPDEGAAAPHDEAWWRKSVAAARAALERDQLLTEAMQSRINALTNDVTSRDDPAQRAVLIEQRLRAITELDHLRQALAADRKALDDLNEAARIQGVPPAWIRGGPTPTQAERLEPAVARRSEAFYE